MPDVELIVGENAYVSVGDADIYLATRLYADDWTATDETRQAQALITATRNIDRLRLSGRKAASDQTLAFPRHGTNEVPQAVIDATCEEALALLDGSGELRHTLRRHGITSVSLGNVREGYANRSMRTGAAITPDPLRSVEARSLLQPYIAGSVPIV